MISLDGKAIRCFGYLFDKQVPPFCSTELANPIYLLEELAVAAALDLWTGLLEGSELVCFIDNEGVLGSLISCKASAAYFAPILDFITSWEEEKFVCPWYERVPARQTLQTAPLQTATSFGPGSRSGFSVPSFVSRVAHARDCPRGNAGRS